MANSTISALPAGAQTGANVDVDADFLPIDDVSAGNTKRISPKELIANSATFLQSGAGAVARTQQDKDREIVSITDFGAAPSKSAAANDTAIIAAIASLPVGSATTAGGGILTIPEGLFNYATAINHLQRIKFKGDGPFSSVLNYTGNGDGIDSATTGALFEMEDLCLRGIDGTGTIGYRLRGTASTFSFRNVRIEGFTQAGINMQDDAQEVRVEGGVITNCGNVGDVTSAAIRNTGTTQGVYINSNLDSNNGFGIYNNAIVKGWEVHGSMRGNTLGGLRGGGFNALAILGVYFESLVASTYAMNIDNLVGAQPLSYGVTIAGCTVGSAPGGTFDSLALSYIDGLNVFGNHIRPCRRFIDASAGNLTNYRVHGNTPIANASSGVFYNGTDDNNAALITGASPSRSAGTGADVIYPTGRHTVNTTQVISSANPTTVKSVTIKKNTLSANGMGIHVVAWGTWVANGNAKRVDIAFGGSTVAALVSSANGVGWKLEGWIWRTGAATQKCVAQSFSQGETPTIDTLALAIDNTADQTLAIIARCAAAVTDCVSEGWYVEIIE